VGVRYVGWLGGCVGSDVLSGGAGLVGCCCYYYCWLGSLGCLGVLEMVVVVMVALRGRDVVGVRGVEGTWKGSGDG
jgi:hypothetical protein